MNNKVINIFSFNRPVYLGKVIEGLKRNNLEGWDVVLWQDGYKNSFRELPDDTSSLVKSCVELFALAFPGSVIAGGFADDQKNWGTGITYQNAKEHTFAAYDLALFIEDDLVPGIEYLDLLLHIHEQVKDNPLIAQISAYGPDRLLTDKEQEVGAFSFEPCKPNWGYLLSKEQWLRRKDLLKPYWSLIEGKDYKTRDHAAIEAWMASEGYPIKSTSQDTADALAINKAGEVKLSTCTRNATYIGATGLNFTEAQYEAGYYGKDRVWKYSDLNLIQFRIPTEAQLRAMNQKIKEDCLI